jgi:hypothetical protein
MLLALACGAMLFRPSGASAQSPSPWSPSPSSPPCIQIYPPPPECSGFVPNPAPPDCTAVYPPQQVVRPPPGCQPPVAPGNPGIVPVTAPSTNPWPGHLSTTPPFPQGGQMRAFANRGVYQRGAQIQITLKPAVGWSGYGSGGFNCVIEDVQVLGGGTWVSAGPYGWGGANIVGVGCADGSMVSQSGGFVMSVPAGLAPGTYRFVLRVTGPSGVQEIVYTDAFSVQ